MRKILATLLAACLMIAVFPDAALADDGTLGGTGMTVYPIYDSEVVMEEEIIDITVRNARSYVNCQFFFRNTGEETELLVGFPTQVPGGVESQEDFEKKKADDYYGESRVTELHRFRTWVDGKRFKVTEKKGLEPEGNNKDALYFPQWYTWTMRLKAGERVKVVNTYWVENSNGGVNTEMSEYILRSGATWKGSIGKVTVRMHMNEFQRFNTAFSGPDFGGMLPSYVEEDGTIVWQAENLEPEYDISAYFPIQIKQYSDYHPILNPFEYGVPEQKVDFDEYEHMGERLLNHFYAGHYNAVTWWADQFIQRFGDKQSWELYYLAGVGYYKKGRYDKALDMFDKAGESYTPCLYYEALIYRERGEDGLYINCLEQMAAKEYAVENDSVYWINLWAQSRLDELNDGVSANAK